MTAPPLVTQRHLEELVRRLLALEKRVGRVEVRERLAGTPLTTRTPTYTGGTIAGATTYTFQSAAYVQLGNVVIDVGQINWSAATGTGEARISLPFAPATYNFTGAVWNSGVTFANNTPQPLLGVGAYFVLESPLTNAASARVQMEAAGSIIWTIAYFV